MFNPEFNTVSIGTMTTPLRVRFDILNKGDVFSFGIDNQKYIVISRTDEIIIYSKPTLKKRQLIHTMISHFNGLVYCWM